MLSNSLMQSPVNKDSLEYSFVNSSNIFMPSELMGKSWIETETLSSPTKSHQNEPDVNPEDASQNTQSRCEGGNLAERCVDVKKQDPVTVEVHVLPVTEQSNKLLSLDAEPIKVEDRLRSRPKVKKLQMYGDEFGSASALGKMAERDEDDFAPVQVSRSTSDLMTAISKSRMLRPLRSMRPNSTSPRGDSAKDVPTTSPTTPSVFSSDKKRLNVKRRASLPNHKPTGSDRSNRVNNPFTFFQSKQKDTHGNEAATVLIRSLAAEKPPTQRKETKTIFGKERRSKSKKHVTAA